MGVGINRQHRPECTKYDCYCVDENDSEPICDCGNAATFCKCPPAEDFGPYDSLDDAYDDEFDDTFEYSDEYDPYYDPWWDDPGTPT